jgi:hypothetical protein
MNRTVKMCGTSGEKPNDIAAIVRNTCGDEGWRRHEGKKKKEKLRKRRGTLREYKPNNQQPFV